ncbi:MAG: hypothetical protein O8C63_04505 [Candidatus Methanoperedens sp.]|nr:hypothetical protein [Candidatus Methanoperedens sp.]
MEDEYRKLITGIVVELVKLGTEVIRNKLQKQNNPEKPKKRKLRKKNI